MAEGQGRGGGPPVQHGIYKYINTGIIPKNPSVRGMGKLKKVLDLIESDLIVQLGGPEVVTTAQYALLQDYMKARTITSMVELYLRKTGILDPKAINYRKQLDLHPVLNRSYIQYLRLAKDILSQLFPDGLGRKEQKAMDIIEFGESEYSTKDEKEKTDGQKKKKA